MAIVTHAYITSMMCVIKRGMLDDKARFFRGAGRAKCRNLLRLNSSNRSYTNSILYELVIKYVS